MQALRHISVKILFIISFTVLSGCWTDMPLDQQSGVDESDEVENMVNDATDSAIDQEDSVPVVSVAEGFIVNEDVYRSTMFNVNTVIYDLPGMDDVEVLNITYAWREEEPLTMDVYYPPDDVADVQYPAVIFGLGYRMSMAPLRNSHFYTSWGRLVAAAGMVGIVYDTEEPDQDLELLLQYIGENASALRVDSDRLGFFSSSANVATVMSYLMQEPRPAIRFSVYYYGLSLTPDQLYLDQFAENCAHRGCLAAELKPVHYVDPELPLFVVIAGRDAIPSLNEGLEHFVQWVEAEGAPVTVARFEDGQHGFDTQKKQEEGTLIVIDTIAFMRSHFGLE